MKQRITKLGIQSFRDFTGSNLRFKTASFPVVRYSVVSSRGFSNSTDN